MATEREVNIIRIKDLDTQELSLYAKASEPQLLHANEPDEGVFIAETANVVIRAMEAGYKLESVLVEEQRLEAEAKPVFEKMEELYGAEAMSSIPIYVAEHEVVRDLTGYNLVRGLWAILKRKPLQPLPDFLADKSRVVVLYDVVNPTNVGAIIRSAAALGMDGAILTKASVNPLTRRSARVSMGTVFQMPWTMIDESEELLRCLSDDGFKTVAMALTDNSLMPDDKRLKHEEKIAVFMGTEGAGLPDAIVETCDHRVRIPMGNGVDSLNVAAASAIIFWELIPSIQSSD